MNKLIAFVTFPIRILVKVGEDWADLTLFCMTGKSEMRNKDGVLKDKYR